MIPRPALLISALFAAAILAILLRQRRERAERSADLQTYDERHSIGTGELSTLDDIDNLFDGQP